MTEAYVIFFDAEKQKWVWCFFDLIDGYELLDEDTNKTILMQRNNISENGEKL